MAPVLNEILMPLVERVHGITGVSLSVRSEEEREQTEVVKAYSAFMRTVVLQHLAVIFFSEKNQPHTETILQTILSGLNCSDAQVRKPFLSFRTHIHLVFPNIETIPNG